MKCVMKRINFPLFSTHFYEQVANQGVCECKYQWQLSHVVFYVVFIFLYLLLLLHLLHHRLFICYAASSSRLPACAHDTYLQVKQLFYDDFTTTSVVAAVTFEPFNE